MKTSNTPGPALFASVRSSRDLGLAAFAGGLLVAFALHAGAFIPKLGVPARDGRAAASGAAPSAAAPSVVARRPPMARGSSAANAEPCVSPRG